MRILLLNDQEEKRGGAEEYFYSLKSLMEDNGHEVHVYFSSKNTKLSVFGSIFSIKNLVKTFRAIKKVNPDIIHIHKYNLSLSASPAISAKLLGKKFVVTFHDFGLLCSNGWCVDKNGKACDNPTWIKWVFSKSLSRKGFFRKAYDYVKNKVHLKMFQITSDGYFGPSKEMSKYLLDIFDKKKVHHVPYFIPGKWKFMKKREISNKLLYVGRLEREKGVDRLIDAMCLLPEKTALDIVGDGKEKNALMEQAKHIRNKVTFAGSIPRENIEKYYHDSDMLIMPSLWMEQFGIVGIEAMASGTPVIAAKIGGTGDWLKDCWNGISLESIRPEELAKAIRKMQSTKLLSKYGLNGRRTYEKGFTEKVHYKYILDAYRNVLKND